jgi:hypothetical protein
MASSSGLRRRAERARATLEALRPPQAPAGRALEELGDPTLTRLGVQLVQQQQLDQLEEAEALAQAEGGVPSVGFTRSLDFARAGVRRLPVEEQLRLARWFAERYIGHGVQPRPEVPVLVVPELATTPPADTVFASEAPVPEPEMVVEDGRWVRRSPRPAPPAVVDLRRNGHRRSEGRR